MHPSMGIEGFRAPVCDVSLSLHPQYAQEESRRDEAEKEGREKQERKRDKAIGTEYVLRSRKGEDGEDVHPGRRQSQVRCIQLGFPYLFP